MARTGPRLNIPDLILGLVLALVIPLVVLIAVKGSREEAPGPPGAEAKPKLVLTLEEIDEGKEEYDRIYAKNASLFLRRFRDLDLSPEDRAREALWARTTLERCRKGFTALLEGARPAAARPEVQARIVELQKALQSVNGDLALLPSDDGRPKPAPAGPPRAGAGPSSTPPPPSPPAPAGKAGG